MNIRKLVLVITILALSIGLSSCKKEVKKFELRLNDIDGEYEIYTGIENGDIVNLPSMESEGMIFAGWGDGISIFSRSVEVTDNMSLTVVYETIEDVLSCEETETQNDQCIIAGYSGVATDLKIPQYVNGLIVVGIDSLAFENSNLKTVKIPIDATISIDAFKNSNQLKEVRFYGKHLVPLFSRISSSEYQEIIEQFSDDCQITNQIDENSWEFSDTCPIISVTDTSAKLIIEQVEYYTHDVLINRNLYNKSQFISHFMLGSLRGLPLLETVEIPNTSFWLDNAAFLDCPMLTNISVKEDHPMLSVKDGVLYSKDYEQLLHYPNGLTQSTFTLLGGVEYIRYDAFKQNKNIEKLIISREFEGKLALDGLLGLKEIIVEEGNNVYYAIDGVLYANYNAFEGSSIVRYPASKLGGYFEMPSEVKRLESYAFISNKHLEVIDLGEIEFIGTMAFSFTESLQEVSVPSTVEWMEYFIFVDSSVTKIIINRSLINDGSITMLLNSLGIGNEEYVIYVPDDSLDAYNLDRWWKRDEEHIMPLSEYE